MDTAANHCPWGSIAMTRTDTVDLTISGTLVDVLNGTLRETTVAVDDGEIVALADRPANREIEAEYIAPGLIDAHMHIESSMVTAAHYGNAVLDRGVTSVVADPHEIANVCGLAGVRGMIKDAAHTPLKIRFTAPSSVPASHLQDGGATLDAAAVEDLLGDEQVIALGEVMNVPGVLAGEEAIHDKIEAARERGLTVDGHAPRVTGSELQSVAQYLDTDHESVTEAEALEKLNAGMRVYIREGSCSKNLDRLIGLVNRSDVDSRRLSLCSDDRDVSELMELGSVDFAVRRAIEDGIDPVEAIQLATINTAESYGVPFGRVAPGAPADLALLDDLAAWDVEHVVVDGVVDPSLEAPPETAVETDTVAFDRVEPAELALEYAGSGPARVQVIDAVGRIQTKRTEQALPVESRDGTDIVVPDPTADVAAISVIERHGGSGNIGNGFVHGLGLDRGAVGVTVAHDAHNCLVVGAAFDPMAAVANHLGEVGGGVAAYDPTTDTIETLELPVGGLMSDEPLAVVTEQFETVQSQARALGLDHEGGVHTLTFLALEVIPELRLTTNGLVDIAAFEYTDVILD
ncbi:adenine deaminase [Natrinema versiforme]|nr:adenine deaminase [Natrinema versiforme]